ncbi:hypothetical protein P7C73_g6721, partial [Tremellales sp. Uapishka_1]
MPRAPETPDVKASKALAYITRHGAEKEQLHIRTDGYLRLSDVLARPKMKEVDLEMVLRLVAENAKQRFELFHGYDPSPPMPRKGKGKGKGKAKPKPLVEEGEVDGGQVDDLRQELATATISVPEIIELPLVSIPLEPDGPSESRAEYFIRATQGHSIELESTSHLTPVNDDEEGRTRAGDMVHGTKWELWETLKRDGLSKMARQHIHLAPAMTGQIIPRAGSTLLIYLSLPALLSASPPIPVYTSLNGVVLTPGDKDGKVAKELWRKAVRVEKGVSTVVWQDGREVSGAEEEI